MRRHLLLTRQPRQYLLGLLLLKRQPLAKRIARQQALLPNALGVHTQPERLPKADPQQFWQPHGADFDATTWPLISAEVDGPLILADAEEDAVGVEAQVSDRLGAITLPTSEAVQSKPGNIRERHNTDLEAKPLVPLLATPEPSRVLPELPPGEEGMMVEDVRAENQVAQRLEQPGKAIQPEKRMARSRISEGQVNTEKPIHHSSSAEKMNGHGERARRNELTQEIDTNTLSHAQSVSVEDANLKQSMQTEGARVEQSALTGRGNTERRESDELFAPGAVDRSPRAWLARLQRQAGAEQTRKMPAPAAAAEPPTQRARTFLNPLLGIDLAEVPVYRDTQTEQTTSALNADAFSVGATVGIAPAYAEETPEGLGLLAHELTHVVRQQRPRFIPPVVRPVVAASGPQSGQETSDEEALAIHVEQRVRRLARVASTSDAPLEGVPREPEQATVGKLNEERAERGIWGNLPAPWEPLPAWLVQESPASSQPSPALAAVQTPAVPHIGSFNSEASATHTGVTEAPIMRAGRERSVSDEPERESDTEQGSREAERQLEPEPDLDALAQQVYGLLKRRLGVEQRRGGLM